jgi:competence protein ComEC
MKLKNSFIFLFISVMVIAVSGCVNHQTTSTTVENAPASANLTLHVIDVGQGDSLLLTCGTHDMLIDAGEIDKGEVVEKYVKSQGVSSFDYVVATHPHADHIGGMHVVLADFPVSHFLYNGETHTTQTFIDMLKQIKTKNIPFKIVHRGDTIDFAPGINITVFNPGKAYLTTDPINQNSIVLKVVDGKESFLLTGDAGIQAEDDMMKAGLNLRADILKVGHHGSRTASGQAFLDAVKPTTSIVSVGANNVYRLPDSDAMARIKAASFSVYRTDYNGTVTVTTDGNTCTVSTER